MSKGPSPVPLRIPAHGELYQTIEEILDSVLLMRHFAYLYPGDVENTKPRSEASADYF